MAVLALGLSGAVARADWLVTRGGLRIETQGPWQVRKGQVIFTDAKGTLSSGRLADFDLPASQAATAASQQPPAAPAKAPAAPVERRPPALVVTDADVRHVTATAAAAEPGQAPKVILYSTSWCGYCRKTRQLLAELNTPYEEKDIEKSPTAAAEYRMKGRGGHGVPLLDVGGVLIRGYNEGEIRRRVAALTPKRSPS